MELLPQDLKLTVEECLLDENLLNLGKLIGEGGSFAFIACLSTVSVVSVLTSV